MGDSSSSKLVKPQEFEYQSTQSRHDEDEPAGDGVALAPLYFGISADFSHSGIAAIAMAVHDAVYLRDTCVKHVEIQDMKDNKRDVIADYVLDALATYSHKNSCKFIGAGVPQNLTEKSPKLCSGLWAQLDIVPITLHNHHDESDAGPQTRSEWNTHSLDEQADSMSRKCLMFFGPKQSPLLQVGFRGLVEIDAGFRAEMCTVEDYQKSCSTSTWNAMMHFATNLKKKQTKIAFFSSTPQGGGVALMRHALVRFARLVGIDLRWYVPKPKPGVFRITKTMHNILQGVAEPDEKITAEQKNILKDWIKENAERYWLPEGGPLRSPSEGGADIIFVDDPQMPALIGLIKKITPNRPVLFRSHIQIRGDLADTAGTPQADVWNFLWEDVRQADMFVSHPVPSFVPSTVPKKTLAYLPATTDWLDGLNKSLTEWDMGYYIQIYNMQCHVTGMPTINYPTDKYIIQVARFDPAKGIPDVLKAYTEFRRLLVEKLADEDAPKLLIVGNSSIDDPDGTRIYEQTISHIKTKCPDLKSCISVMRLDPNDQLLNALLSGAHIALQLSTREGFEVKVSEALHKGRPTIATKAGGIPLQVQHGKNGFLVEESDWKAVAGHLVELWTDEKLYTSMSKYARKSVSDEVHTVGNALSWFFLADKWTQGEGISPSGRWVNDLAREEAGIPYVEGENRLPRLT